MAVSFWNIEIFLEPHSMVNLTLRDESVLLCVLQYSSLQTCSVVCRTWRKCSLRSPCYARVMTVRDDEGSLESLLSTRGPYLHKLTLEAALNLLLLLCI